MADDKAEGVCAAQTTPLGTQEVVEVPIVEESPADAVVVVKNEPKPVECPKKSIIPGKFFEVKRISGLLSVISFVFSLPVLSSVIWLLYMKSYDCKSLFKLPKLQIGINIGLICVFFVCNAALFLRDRLRMVGIVLVMVPMTVMFTIGLTFLRAESMENRRIPATPLWPPAACGLQYVNATYWEKKDKTETDPDCDVWKNSSDDLCYDCLACRQGYVKALQSKWLKLGVFLVCMSLLFISSHLSLFLVTMWELHIS
ncbi:hypothetical protein F3Y22_tig00109991pilonHSYRG00054 [Hibiscus syriacus]|uniref:Uncharacterized protein n=1 Tax=Hibiscus syriacus TaxID=106335 RepID=A0A6A3BPB1_HIBSY|nr:hypothetical protein F3Y22_tig00109991pilonHSYRG00054 [Hibiscus syriacus]